MERPLTSTDKEVLAESLPASGTAVLAMRFSGQEARIEVANLPEALPRTISAMGFPDYFVISYTVAPGSELSFSIDEVLALPRAQTTDCRLPTLTPSQ